MEFDDFGDILYFNDVLMLLGISKSTLLKLLHSGSIPAFRVGRQWRFNKSSLIAYTRKCTNQHHQLSWWFVFRPIRAQSRHESKDPSKEIFRLQYSFCFSLKALPFTAIRYAMKWYMLLTCICGNAEVLQ